MSDDDGIRLRNTSTYGDLDVPDLGQVVAHLHEIVVADVEIAQRLIETGHFIEVAKPGPKPADTTSETTTTPAAEEPTSDHAA